MKPQPCIVRGLRLPKDAEQNVNVLKITGNRLLLFFKKDINMKARRLVCVFKQKWKWWYSSWFSVRRLNGNVCMYIFPCLFLLRGLGREHPSSIWRPAAESCCWMLLLTERNSYSGRLSKFYKTPSIPLQSLVNHWRVKGAPPQTLWAHGILIYSQQDSVTRQHIVIPVTSWHHGAKRVDCSTYTESLDTPQPRSMEDWALISNVNVESRRDWLESKTLVGSWLRSGSFIRSGIVVTIGET